MAGGIKLGGAYFELEANSAPLIQALKQAEDASKKSVAAISASTGIAEKDVRRLAQTYVTESKRAADARAAATLKIIKADNDAAESSKKLAGSQKGAAEEMLGFVKAGAGFIAAAAGIATGAAAINAAMNKVAEETQKAAQAQFALNQLYGQTAPLVTKQAEAIAKLAGQSRTSAKEAAASVATLARNYALTGAQIETVLKISADLAAVRGISMAQASERVEAALRGEAEAIEYLGQALNSDAIKAMADMTDEQRKYFETLSPITKAQIVLNALMKNTADLQGAAAKRTQDAAGASDNLKAAIDNLSESFGKKLSPEIVGAVNALAKLVTKAEEFVNSKLVQSTIEVERGVARMTAEILRGASAWDTWHNAQITAARASNPESRIQVGPDAGMPGAVAPMTPEQRQAQLQAIKDLDAQRRQADADQKDRVKSYLEFVTKAVDQEADAREKAARAAAKAEDDRIEKAKIGLEVEKAAREKALDDRYRATIKAIEAEEAAAEAATKATIERLEIERQANLDAAEMAKDQALAAIKAKKEQLDQERELEDRARDDERDAEDRRVADARAREDQETEARKQGIARRREEEDRAREDRRKAEDADRDARRKKDDADREQARQKEDREVEAYVQRLQKKREQEDRARQAGREQEDRVRQDRRTREDADLDAAKKRELDAIEATHTARVNAIDAEIQAVKDRQEATSRALDAEADQLRAAYEQASRAADARYEQESRARDAEHEAATRQAEAAHESAMRQMDAEHEARSRAFDQEAKDARDAAETVSRARAAAHETTLRQIEREADAARAANDAILDGIDQQARAEDDRHRAAMRAIDDEEKRRQDAVDAQIASLDALDEADRRAAQDQSLRGAVTNAEFGLKRAQSTGNQSEIVKAQQELDDARAAITRTAVQRERDAARDVLKAQKDAIKAAADAQKRAEDDLNRQRDREIQGAKDAAAAMLKAILDALGVRKQAEQDRYDAETVAAGDALQKVLDGIATRKQAEQDAYDAAKQKAQDTYQAARQAAQDAYDAAKLAAQDSYQAQRQAAQDALDKQLDAIAKRKLAVSDETDAALRKLQERKDAEKVAYDEDVTRINLRYQQARDRITAQRLDEDRALSDRRVKEDQDLKDYRIREDTKLNEDKLRIADRRTKEDAALTERRTKEDIERSGRRIKEDRDRDDRRIAEDLQTKEAGDRLNATRLHEDRDRTDKRTAEDRQRKDFRDAEDLKLSAQQAAVEIQFDAERKATDAHYNGPNGVITLVKRAMGDAKTEYRLRREHAEEQYRLEREALLAVYHNPAHTGLLDLQDAAAKNNRDRLADQLGDIENWKKNAGIWIDENKSKWKDLETAIRSVGSAINGLPNGGRPSGGSGGGSSGGGGGTPPSSGGGGGSPPRSGGGGVQPPGGIGPVAPPGYGGQPGDPGASGSDHAYVVRKAKQGTAWTSGGTHGGHPAVDIMAEMGEPIYAPVSGRISPGTYPLGGNAAIEYGDNGLAYYFAHGKIPFDGGWHEKGTKIGEVGDTGNARGGPPHVHFAVASNANLFGDWNGSGDIGGDTTYWKYARGHLFDEPTMTYGIRSGSRGVIGETGRPERLLGVDDTAALDAMRTLRAPSLMDGASSAPYQFAASATTDRLVGAGAGAAPIERQPIDISIGGILAERLVISGLQIAVRRGTKIPGVSA